LPPEPAAPLPPTAEEPAKESVPAIAGITFDTNIRAKKELTQTGLLMEAPSKKKPKEILAENPKEQVEQKPEEKAEAKPELKPEEIFEPKPEPKPEQKLEAQPEKTPEVPKAEPPPDDFISADDFIKMYSAPLPDKSAEESPAPHVIIPMPPTLQPQMPKPVPLPPSATGQIGKKPGADKKVDDKKNARLIKRMIRPDSARRADPTWQERKKK
jgi:hypothetical protein